MDDPTAEPDIQYTYVDEMPPCDIHLANLDVSVEAAYDGRTQDGPWANMCVPCFVRFGTGLGTGKGQRLFKREGKSIVTSDATGSLDWQDTGMGGLSADSGIIEDGCTSMYWSLGPTDDGWGVELIGTDEGYSVTTAGVHLGTFASEADAKRAAENYEDAHVS